MSKIYEALLRAELDRAIASGRSEENVLPSVQDLKSPPKPAPQQSPEMSGLESPMTDLGSLESLDISNALGPLDLSQITQHAWEPAYISLPGLAERGSEVEQFRSLRSHVMEFREQKPIKTILVSSGLPGEGKSFVAINLALSFARHRGNRVLLIDGDMRRSSLHKLLGAPREPGLTEYLSGEADLLEVMQRPMRPAKGPLPSGLASLTFIGGGKDADKAGDLAANNRFGQLIAAASPSFDWIIVDSSPVNLVSDGVSLAHSADGVLLVGREGVTKYKSAQQAQAQFKSATVLGFVLNAVHKLPSKGDYYGSYDSYKPEV